MGINGGTSQQHESSVEGGDSKGADDSAKPYSEKVDLNDLDWEDRERVLRLLFSKMNTGVPIKNSSKMQANGNQSYDGNSQI